MNFTNFEKELYPFQSKDIVFVGLGNEYRGDDAAGLIFLNRLNESCEFVAAHFVNARTNPENHLEEILGYSPQLVVFIDAARFGGLPGELKWLRPSQVKQAKISTHAFSMDMVEKYLIAHQPMEFKYLAIQPHIMRPNQPLSTMVEQKLNQFFGLSQNKTCRWILTNPR